MVGLSIVHLIIAVIIIAAVIAILYIALKQFGVTIPAFVIQIFWVLVVAFIAIVAIKFLLSMSW